MKAVEMNDLGKLIMKYAAFEDLFELEDIAQRLRDTTPWDYTTPALSGYMKGKRTPKPEFFQYLKTALNLDEDSYQLLLFIYHQAQPSLSSQQMSQVEMFRKKLYEQTIRGIRGEGLNEAGTAH